MTIIVKPRFVTWSPSVKSHGNKSKNYWLWCSISFLGLLHKLISCLSWSSNAIYAHTFPVYTWLQKHWEISGNWSLPAMALSSEKLKVMSGLICQLILWSELAHQLMSIPMFHLMSLTRDKMTGRILFSNTVHQSEHNLINVDDQQIQKSYILFRMKPNILSSYLGLPSRLNK